jgi:uncharacterized protein YjbI with pentapeptide repeats
MLRSLGYTVPRVVASPLYLDTGKAGKVPAARVLRLIYSRIMAEEQEITSDASEAAEGDRGEVGCPIEMYYDDNPEMRRKCGRKLHVAPDGIDEKPVCLMHSKDPRKQSGQLFVEFRQEFERILEKAGEGEAHFEGFIFHQLSLFGRKFRAICRFVGATFTQDADFPCATFTKDADFAHAIFTRNANFWNATFKEGANFYEATFTQYADFREATFTQYANFSRVTFTQNAAFNLATFTQAACFGLAVFTQNSYFYKATFMQNAEFSGVTFTQDADFHEATFTQNAQFHGANFTQDADFSGATFTQNAEFEETKFYGMAYWTRSRFLDQAEFRHTKFEPLDKAKPSAVFAQARFSKPSEIIFDDVDLSRTLFHNCDVSQVWFTSSVRWVTRKNNFGYAVFDETIPLDQKQTEGLKRDGQRDYQAVAQVYRQLKKNYDSRLDYWTANMFHFGEMEMMRLAEPAEGKLHAFLRVRPMWLRQWLLRRLRLVALYRWASDYGNRYVKPMLWLLTILVLFAALLPLPGVGLMRQGATQPETYISVWNLQKSFGENLWAESDLTLNSLIASVDTATFQRSAEYAPAYPWGRVLAILETLLTSSLFALFLLALRRQFRR